MIIAIDAGVRKCGLAIGKVGQTVRNPYLESTRGPKALDAAWQMANELAGIIRKQPEAPEIVLVELPMGRGAGDFANYDIGNVGAAMGALSAMLEDADFRVVYPAQWNGSREKGHWKDAILGWGGVVVNTPPSMEADAWDALGLAMWYDLGGLDKGSLRKILEPAPA